MGISELECFLLGPGDEEISVVSLAENARDVGGYSRFVVPDTRRHNEVAHAVRVCEESSMALE